MNQKELQKILCLRKWVYHFLAIALYTPLTQDNMAPFLEDNILTAGQDDPNLRKMAQALDDFQHYTETDWQDIKREYNRVFPESGPMPVHPWESVYRNREHVLFDEHTLAVKECMEQWHLAPTAKERIPVDHIGLECSFLASLTEFAIHNLSQQDFPSLRKNLLAQQNFLREHLLTWAKDFCRDFNEATNDDFYQALAEFLPLWLEQDIAVLADLDIC